jgi:hypothetical protein
MKALARGLAGAFLFSSLPFDRKRDLLRRAVRKIMIKDGAIPSITLQGGFLSEILGCDTGANLLSRSTSRCWRRCPAPAAREGVERPAAFHGFQCERVWCNPSLSRSNGGNGYNQRMPDWSLWQWVMAMPPCGFH